MNITPATAERQGGMIGKKLFKIRSYHQCPLRLRILGTYRANGDIGTVRQLPVSHQV